MSLPVRRNRICYFLVCYMHADYVLFLLSSLYNPDDFFIIHCDPKAPLELQQLCSSIARRMDNVLYMKPQSYSWAGFSHVDISCRAIELALQARTDWSHFIFLSEQHLPLKGPDVIAAALSSKRSVFVRSAVSSFPEEAKLDISNRFASVFRELPGVGCFATRLRDRPEDLIETAYHGSNWIILHRDHCAALRGMAASGQLEVYKTIVHSEELAIPTLLNHFAAEIENVDLTVVAHPHLTDNHALVMTDNLFKVALGSDALFIRKRPAVLSQEVREAIRSNHFFDFAETAKPDAFDLNGQSADETGGRNKYVQTISDFCLQQFGDDLRIESLDVKTFSPSPRVHLSLTHKDLPKKISVRVLSEDLTTFRVAIVEDDPFAGVFSVPTISGGAMRSTLRVRVYGLFGNTEILPTDLPNAGFVDGGLPNGHEALIDMIRKQIDAAMNLFACTPGGSRQRPDRAKQQGSR